MSAVILTREGNAPCVAPRPVRRSLSFRDACRHALLAGAACSTINRLRLILEEQNARTDVLYVSPDTWRASVWEEGKRLPRWTAQADTAREALLTCLERIANGKP